MKLRPVSIIALVGFCLGALAHAVPQPKRQIRKLNAALSESLHLLITPPSLAQLKVLTAVSEPASLSLTGNYSRVVNKAAFGLHLAELTFRAQTQELQIVGAVSFSRQMRRALFIPDETEALDRFIHEKLVHQLGAHFSKASTRVIVHPLKKNSWQIEFGYRVGDGAQDLMATSLDCQLELSLQLLSGKCRVGLDSGSARWVESRERTAEFIDGLLRTDPEALQWWVDFVASWDAWVRGVFPRP